MKLSTGIDLIEVDRIKKAIEKSDRFLHKIYSEVEISYCEDKGREKYKSYAARFAAKEAYVKALGTGFTETVSPDVIEIRNNEVGKPVLFLNNKIIPNCDVTLSHSKSHAIAYVVIVEEN